MKKKKSEVEQVRSQEEIYKSLRKQKNKSIRFVVILVTLLVFMAIVSVYFIVFNNIDSFLHMFQHK